MIALPSARQLAWHEKPFYGFVHLSPNTFTGLEWGYGDEDPAIFAPTALDCRQWARVAREAGMARLILTAKHHDGFCLWPTKWTEHCVRNSPWREGRGDVVHEFVDACAAEGIEAGLYLSPWDRNRADYGTPAYRDYYLRQLEELFTRYGPLAEVWFDGANGGDGYYGGAREKRAIDQKSYYPWAEILAARDRWQPQAVLFGNFGGADLRWIGNEAGKPPTRAGADSTTAGPRRTRTASRSCAAATPPARSGSPPRSTSRSGRTRTGSTATAIPPSRSTGSSASGRRASGAASGCSSTSRRRRRGGSPTPTSRG